MSEDYEDEEYEDEEYEEEEYEDLCTTAHVDEVIGDSKELAKVFLAINGKDFKKNENAS